MYTVNLVYIMSKHAKGCCTLFVYIMGDWGVDVKMK